MFTTPNSEQDRVTVFKNVEGPSEAIFLFIGDLSFYADSFRQYFIYSSQVASLKAAKKMLLSGHQAPQMIVLDIPLAHLELIEFKVWLRANQFHHIPIIYNESALNRIEIRRLFSQRIIDDVVSIEYHYLRLQEKSTFLTKIHQYNSGGKSIVKTGTQKKNSSPSVFIKRLFDIIFSLALVVCSLPIIILIAVLIKLESKGPVFYLSNRAGKGFKIFKFYKFRTMVLDADKKINEFDDLNLYINDPKLPAFFKLKDDPRVTKFGSLLRRVSLDELPQLFNVLIGDMSLVGNRPLPLYEAATLTTDEWAIRFMAPAGITGLWQVSKQGKENMTNEERILLDIKYARTCSLFGDFRILLQTPAALVQKTNV